MDRGFIAAPSEGIWHVPILARRYGEFGLGVGECRARQAVATASPDAPVYRLYRGVSHRIARHRDTLPAVMTAAVIAREKKAAQPSGLSSEGETRTSNGPSVTKDRRDYRKAI